jgi:hypothetical protein
LAITFVSDDKDAEVLNEVQERFDVSIGELPDEIEVSSYSEYMVFISLIFEIKGTQNTMTGHVT